MSKLYGLYLAGGKSSRMGSPKWALEFSEEKTFLENAVQNLKAVCEECFVSTASANPDISFPQIIDTQQIGPLGGLVSAHQAHPEASWLVVGSDLPAVTAEDLRLLTDHLDGAEAVAFSNPVDHVPEATVTLYTSEGIGKIAAACDEGLRCMRHALDEVELNVIPAPNPYTLQNVNYPADYTEWKLRKEAGFKTPQLEMKVEYYAKLRQDAGIGEATVKTFSCTVAGLWEECRLTHHLSLKQSAVKPAVNNAFVSWDHLLEEGDLVAFMPPFAGG